MNWTGATGGIWGTDANWSTSLAPTSADDATILGPNNVAGALTININAAAVANSISFTDTAAVTVSNTTSGANQTLTISAGSGAGITTGSGAVTIGSATANQNINIALGASQTWNVGSAAGVTGLTVNNVISGIGFSLTKTGTGTLQLGGANTFTGGVFLNAGAIIPASSTALGSSGNVTFGGGILSYAATAGVGADVSARIKNSTSAIAISASSGKNVVFAGNIDSSNTGGLTFSNGGTGTLALSGSNTYTGGTTLNGASSGSTLFFNNSSAIGSGTFTISATNAGTIGTTAASDVTLTTNNAQAWNGNFNYSAASTHNLNLGTGAVTLGGGTRTVTVNNRTTGNVIQTLTVGGAIGDGGSGFGLTKAGASTLELTGASTYSGATTVNSGTLSVSSLANGGSNSGIGASSNAATNLVLNGGTLQYLGSGDSTDRLFSVGTSGGTLDASGTAAVNFTNTGALAFNGQTGTRTFTLTGTNTGTNTLAAAIGDNGGATNLTKNGAGTWVLSGANTYTGATTVDGGSLKVSGSINGTTSLAVNNGGSFLLGAADAVNNSATVTLGGGTLATAGFSDTVGALTLTANSTIDFGTSAISNAFQFGASTVAWSSGTTLTITNWTTGVDHLFFGTDSTGLSLANINAIRFENPEGFAPGIYGAQISSSGEVFAVVPEPSTLTMALGFVGLIVGMRHRRN